MWLKILKIVAKVAVASGLVDKGAGWLKDKITGSADVAEHKANQKVDKVEKEVDEIYKVFNG
jgi:hypothetical protein